eukprot:4035044-Karenia_brevis.AAC.1
MFYDGSYIDSGTSQTAGVGWVILRRDASVSLHDPRWNVSDEVVAHGAQQCLAGDEVTNNDLAECIALSTCCTYLYETVDLSHQTTMPVFYDNAFSADLACCRACPSYEHSAYDAVHNSIFNLGQKINPVFVHVGGHT